MPITDSHSLLLLDSGYIVHNGPGIRVLDLNTCKIAWHGLVFMDHRAAGAESVCDFAFKARQDVAKAAASLKGIYFLVMRDKSTGVCTAFVDNSGLYHAYYSRCRAGTSFLQLAAMEGLGCKDVDPESLVEFFHFGCIFFGKTFFSQIQKIGADVILRTSPQGKLEHLRKHTQDISVQREQSFESMLATFSNSVAGESISLDLTGGIDSRLLAVVLDYFGLRFEVAASGTPGNHELLIADTVAESIGRELHVTYHDCRLTDWDQLCAICDGMFDPTKASRPVQLHSDRQQRGITLTISGAGGELFKDFWWLQDFPFYFRRNPNLARLYDLRIANGAIQHSYLSPPYRSLSETYRDKLLRLLSSYSDGSNTRTYDRIYYSFKMPAVAGRFIKNALAYLQIYAPFLERDAVSVGYNLSRWQRFFNHYHRCTISRYSPEAACLPTTEGHMSTSSNTLTMARDLSRYLIDRWKRLQRKLKKTPDTFVQESPDDPTMPEHLFRLLDERGSIERLKSAGILSASFQLNNAERGYLGQLFALDWILQKLEQNDGVSACHRV